MGGILEFCQLPESSSGDLTIQKALHIIEDGIVRHRAFHHIIVMGNSIPACRNKIQPFIAHFQEALDLELGLVIEGIDIDNPGFSKARCPAQRLLFIGGAVKAPVKILMEFLNADLGLFHNHSASMVKSLHNHPPSSLYFIIL